MKNYNHCLLIVVFIMTIFLTSCSREPNLDNVDITNACQILSKQIEWKNSLKITSEKYGIPPSLVMAVIYQESKFKATAKNPQSSAYGYAQVIDSTWKNYEKQEGGSQSRSDFLNSTNFIGWYLSKLKYKLNLNWSDQKKLYIAYLLGEHGYHKYYLSGSKNKRIIEIEKIAKGVASLSVQYKDQMLKCE